MSGRGDFGSSSYGSTTASYQRYSSSQNGDFSALCDSANGKIFLVNKNVSKLEGLSRSIDTSVDNKKELESKIHALFQETNELATDIQSIFKQTLEYTRSGRFESHDIRHGQYNLQQNKLRKELENSLSRYHAIQNVLTIKMKANIEHERDVSTSHQELSAARDDEEMLIQDDRLNQQVQLEADIAETREREKRLLQIEEDVLNVNEIFRDLALLVHEQGQAVDSIESNIEHAALNVSDGKDALVRAKGYQKSYRKKMCIIFTIIAVVVLILALIIYGSTN